MPDEHVVHLQDSPHSVEISRNASGGVSFAVKVYGQSIQAAIDEAKSHFTTIFATSIHNYSDEELITRRRELLSRLDELRGTGNGKIIEVHPTTGGEAGDGGVRVQGQATGYDPAKHGTAGSPPDAAGNVSGSTPESHS